MVRPGCIVEFQGLDGLFVVFSHRVLALCLWRVVVSTTGGKNFFGLDPTVDASKFMWRCVTDFSQCKAVPYTFMSPMDIYLASGNRWPGSIPQVFAIQSGAADNPVRQAARYGFTDMPMALVEKLLRLEFGESTEGLTKSQKLMLAVRRSLQCSDEEAADILERRLTDGFDSAAIAEMLQTDGVDDVIDSSDHKLVTDYCKGARDTTEEAKELQNTIRVVRQASAKAKAKARGKKNTERRPQVKLPGDRAISQVEASSLLPPDCKIRRDEHQKRWHIVMGSENEAGGRWSKSRSWGIGGDERAAVEFCIRAAWERHCLLTSTPSPLI